MIDLASIKNKSVVTIEKNGEELKCKVVDTTHLTCTLELPDGSHYDMPKMYVKSVETTASKSDKTVVDPPHSTEV